VRAELLQHTREQATALAVAALTADDPAGARAAVRALLPA
jgi:hypothetical protein